MDSIRVRLNGDSQNGLLLLPNRPVHVYSYSKRIATILCRPEVRAGIMIAAVGFVRHKEAWLVMKDDYDDLHSLCSGFQVPLIEAVVGRSFGLAIPPRLESEFKTTCTITSVEALELYGLMMEISLSLERVHVPV